MPPASAALTPIQHLAVRYLASGMTLAAVSESLKLQPVVLKKWREIDPTFKAALEQATASHIEMVEAMLVAGEKAAASTLIAALSAETMQGKPAWTVRLQAALSLLDRAGQRGKAIDRQVNAQFVKQVEAHPEEALRAALRDPGVRTWLKREGTLQRLLPAESEVTSDEIEVTFNVEPIEESA